MKKRYITACVLIALLSSCELFYSSVFPEYFGNVLSDYSYINSITDQFATTLARSRYQFFSVEYGASQQVFLLVSPDINISDIADSRGRLFHFDSLGVLQRIISVPLDESNFTLRNNFGSPFLVANTSTSQEFTGEDLLISGNISINIEQAIDENSVIRPRHVVYGPVNHTFSNGHGLSIKLPISIAGTYLFSGQVNENASNENGYFILELVAFTPERPSQPDAEWEEIPFPPAARNLGESATIQIVPQNMRQGAGYILSGIVPLETDSGIVDRALFLFENRADNRLYLWTVSYQNIHGYYQGSETRSIFELNTESNISIDLNNSEAFYFTYRDSIIVYRNNGRMLRYNFQGQLQDSIKAEKRQGLLFYFSSNGEFFYRMDPELLRIQVFRTWW